MKRLFFLLVCTVAMLGCSGEPMQLSPAGKSMLNKFKSQVERKSRTTLDQLCEQAKDQNKKGTLRDDEYAVIQVICDKVADGRFEEAGELIDNILQEHGSD